jgi:hypothetical protein
VFDPFNHDNNLRLLATLGTAFPHLYQAGDVKGNIYLVGSPSGMPERRFVAADIKPEKLSESIQTVVAGLHEIPPSEFHGHEPLTDDKNLFNVLFSKAQQQERQSMVASYPPAILVN